MKLEDSTEFIANSSVGIHMVSSEGIIEYANDCELEILGYLSDEYIGHHVSEFQINEANLDDMMCRLGNFEILKNYPAEVRGKRNTKYILYSSSAYKENNVFVHTRCYGVEIDKEVYELIHKTSPYFK
jgi:hypothetical protein